jgi:hypothetical protein
MQSNYSYLASALRGARVKPAAPKHKNDSNIQRRLFIYIVHKYLKCYTFWN